jgi:nucleotide-binding universal stress UspA family protein
MNKTGESRFPFKVFRPGSPDRRFMNISNRESCDAAEPVESGKKRKVILAPIKIANGSNGALKFATELARLWRAKLYVLYVHSPLPKVSASTLVYAVDSVDWERRRRLINLFQLVDKLRETHQEVYPLFTDNDCPAESIRNIGRQVNADLIIVSTHDMNWLAQMFLYSDSDDIARKSTVPVLVYREKARAEELDASVYHEQNR